MERVRLDIPVILPDVEDLRDACIEHLVQRLSGKQGVLSVHVVDRRAADDASAHPEVRAGEAQLCLHYDPALLSLAQLSALARSAGAEVTDRFAHVVIPFHRIGSEDDGTRIERTLMAIDGITSASVNLAAQVARVEFDRRATNEDAVRAALLDTGVQARAAAHAATPKRSWYRRNRELAWSITAGALMAAGWIVERATGNSVIAIALFAVSYAFGARDNVAHTLKDLRGGRFRFNIDFLMVVAAIGAAILGEWFEGALLLFLFSLGHALEHYALGRARNAIKALAELAPQTAMVLRDGKPASVPIEQVNAGDHVLVKPAERIPVDGNVIDGRSGVNQAPITGESMPVTKQPGEQVFAGSVNGEGALTIEVTAAIGDRTLDRVIKLVADAETQKAPTQLFTDRFERLFVPVVLVADVLLIVVPPLLGVWEWSESFYRGMALLVAASPCALALGTPAAVLAGIAQAARNGVLIKGGAHLETLGLVDVLALDKTGTITVGEPSVTDVAAGDGVTEARLLAIAAAVEQRSQHPVARAVVRAAEERGVNLPVAGELESVTGKGVRGPVEGIATEIGRLLMFEETGGVVPGSIKAHIERLELSGRTTMIVRQTGAKPEWLGVLAVADEPRAGVKDILNTLRAAGMKRIVMLTGDNPGVARAIADRVGIDDVRASLLPEDKVTAIKELAATGRVAMVGDGVNDAPALAHATVGIAMGGAGTAAALETADVALMADDLSRLGFAIRLSRRARAVIKQNLFVSLGVIALLGIATVTGVAGIGVAVIAHEGSTLVVIANALRLLVFK